MIGNEFYFVELSTSAIDKELKANSGYQTFLCTDLLLESPSFEILRM